MPVSNQANTQTYQRGYLTSLFYWLLEALGFVPIAALDGCHRIQFASGTCAGLAKIFHDDIEVLESCHHLAMLRLRALAELMKQVWRHHGSAMP